MRVHRNILLLHARPESVDQLVADKAIALLVLARPAPELVAIKRAHHKKLLERLEKLGIAPRELGQW